MEMEINIHGFHGCKINRMRIHGWPAKVHWKSMQIQWKSMDSMEIQWTSIHIYGLHGDPNLNPGEIHGFHGNPLDPVEVQWKNKKNMENNSNPMGIDGSAVDSGGIRADVS